MRRRFCPESELGCGEADGGESAVQSGGVLPEERLHHDPPAVDGVPWRPLTAVPFGICLARYAVMVRSGNGEAPEDALLGDRWLQIAGFSWLVLFALSVHAAS